MNAYTIRKGLNGYATIGSPLDQKVIAFQREKAGQALVCAANFGLEAAKITLPRSSLTPQFSHGDFTLDADHLTLGPLAVIALS